VIGEENVEVDMPLAAGDSLRSRIKQVELLLAMNLNYSFRILLLARCHGRIQLMFQLFRRMKFLCREVPMASVLQAPLLLRVTLP
jgi:hypothetical protein